MPQTPDEFGAALFVLIVLGTLLIVGVGRLVVWVVASVERTRAVSYSRVRSRAYVAPEPMAVLPNERAEPGLNSAEPARPVQAEQPRTDADAGPLSISEIETLDKLGQLFASKALSSEAAAVEAFFPGVKRGGSKRYLQLRDHLRAAAIRHGWKAPEPPAVVGHTPIAGRPVPPGVEFAEETV
jgi:hypothetical protein